MDITFAQSKPLCRSAFGQGGKSGQHRVPHFLTGRFIRSNPAETDSATETYRPPLVDKGEIVR